MIKAHITFSDLAQAPVWRDGAIHVGSSRFTPYRHHALETLIVRTDSRWFAMIRECAAGQAVAKETPEDRTVDSDQFSRLYQEALMWPLDYLMIEVAQQGCRLKIRAGLLGIAPVYCRTTDDGMFISHDFSDFLGQSTLIDLEIVSRRLALYMDYSARQICSGILMLTERAMLYAEPGKTHYRYPNPISPPSPSGQAPENHGLATFNGLLERAVSARPAKPRQIAVELSGGMDSATVAGALGSVYGPIASFGILLDDSSGNDQAERRRRITERLGLRDETLDIETVAPILDLQPNPARTEYPLPEIYLEAFEGLWDKAQSQGHELLFTGIGGDQLFPVYSNELQPTGGLDNSVISAAKRHAECLLTPKARSAARTLNGLNAPPGLLSPSVLASHVCQAPHLLRRGLWPVNPLSDPELSAFCYRLPAENRRGREMMRQYLNMRIGEGVFVRDYVKETFAHVLPKRIAAQAKTIAAQLRECALADLGLVDRNAVLVLLDELTATRSRPLTAPLISFLWMERFVRQVA